MKQAITARVENVVPITMDSSIIRLVTKVWEGPNAILDRRVDVILAPADVKRIVALYEAGAAQREKVAQAISDGTDEA